MRMRLLLFCALFTLIYSVNVKKSALKKFNDLIDEDINYLGRQIISLIKIRDRILAAAAESQKCFRNDTKQLLARESLTNLYRLILDISRLMKLREEMRFFVNTEYKNARDWNDDCIKEYPLEARLKEYLDTIELSIKSIKQDIIVDVNAFLSSCTKLLQSEHVDGVECTGKCGPFHSIFNNNTFGIDLQKLVPKVR